MMLCSATGAYGVTSATDTTPGGGKLSPYTQHFLRLDKMGLIDDNGMMRLPARVEGIVAKDANGKAAATAQRRLVTRMTNNGGTRMVESFIRLSPEGSVADIEAAGVEVANEIGDILVVRMPADQIEQVAALDAVQSIDISQPLRLLNNTTREFTRTDLVQQGGGSLEQPYTGKGVIVGIIDSGIEYNHINFMAADNQIGFNEASSYINTLLYFLNIEYSLESVEGDERFIPGRAARIMHSGRQIGIYGEVHPQVLESWGCSMPAIMAEFDLDLMH